MGVQAFHATARAANPAIRGRTAVAGWQSRVALRGIASVRGGKFINIDLALGTLHAACGFQLIDLPPRVFPDQPETGRHWPAAAG